MRARGKLPPCAKRSRLQTPSSDGTSAAAVSGAGPPSSGYGAGGGGLGLAVAVVATGALLGDGDGELQPPAAKRSRLQTPSSDGTSAAAVSGAGPPSSGYGAGGGGLGLAAAVVATGGGLSVAEIVALCAMPRLQPSTVEVDHAMKVLQNQKPPPAPPGSLPMHLRPAALQAMIVAIQEGRCPQEAASVFITEVAQ
ncbi:hypothetical protein CHLRE_21g752197v5 [Chlamydomonas reinhardtii]|uniref:Uncharacterized protein n=1 Tax=Chlamydomonas reinhardtii TaxID=3055 RepID=A0A2K3CN93_CHLRE|nr:uncharacterized protein CHLRE_21g752197v5 [Chlamydomonas reinhardtii]PNW69751.1 hypothetical protein CHLRE_21g752197v5 [Chlamydomonas reinhardtii]